MVGMVCGGNDQDVTDVTMCDICYNVGHLMSRS